MVLTMKYDICALGEILIDAITNADSEIRITGNAGGAPANVLACAANLKLKTALISKAGDDYIGRWLKEVLDNTGIDTEGLVLSKNKNTTIAMVSLSKDGNRSFSFYRTGCADVSLDVNDLRLDIIENSRVFHFGSVSMTDEPVRSATIYAAQFAREKGLVVSYDPNIRCNLWDNKEDAVKYIKRGLVLADVAKLADVECEFLYGKNSLRETAMKIFADFPNLKMLFITCGENGSYAFCGTDASAFMPSFKVRAVDTTGAGDSFVGAVLTQLIERNLKLTGYSDTELAELLTFSNAVGALSVQKYGAIAAMPTLEEVNKFRIAHNNKDVI